MVINPEKEAAEEILRILKYPSAKNIDTFAKGKINIVSFTATKNCTLCGQAVKDSFSGLKARALACAVERENKIFIPFGDSVIEENDVVAVLVSPNETPIFFKRATTSRSSPPPARRTASLKASGCIRTR